MKKIDLIQTKLIILFTVLACLLSGCANFTSITGKQPEKIRIALVHLAPRPGDTEHNRSKIESAIATAVAAKADWIVTPELAETGYDFFKSIGTNWIENFPSKWMLSLSKTARLNKVALFIGFAERDSTTGKLHNSVAIIGRDGVIQGTYRKHIVVHGVAESWTAPGIENNLFILDGIPVGMLICADSYKPEIAARYKLQGARILLSPANWPPHKEMGPNGYWEARTMETGLPLIVNNRTGIEPDLDFSTAESSVVLNGKRLYNFSSRDSRIFLVDWNLRTGTFSLAVDPAVEKF
ncbi:MAG: carbon-nitrogen hydrolase family protein [Smithella sp.]